MASQADVAIIGGGILGVILGRLTAERGLRTVVFRMSDLKTPTADTLRNQSWLQSGLRYVQVNKVLAEKMWIHGRRMHEFFGLKPPDGRGILQVGSEDEASRVYDDASELGLSAAIRELAPETARSLLGPLHRADGIAFETPETPFEEAMLLREARETARAAGAKFREVLEPVELLPLPQQRPSHRIRFDGHQIEVGTTILAAGAGNLPLLRKLSSNISLELRQTPLLVITGDPLIRSPILLDRTGGFSIVAHPAGTCRRDGCMVIGADVHENDIAYCPPEMRRIGPQAQRDLYDRLPKCIQARIGTSSRLTAGWEPVTFRNGARLPLLEPLVEKVDGHPDVIVSWPGRATLALHAAEMVLDELSFRASSRGNDLGSGWNGILPGRNWDADARVCMHYEEHYDGLNDG